MTTMAGREVRSEVRKRRKETEEKEKKEDKSDKISGERKATENGEAQDKPRKASKEAKDNGEAAKKPEAEKSEKSEKSEANRTREEENEEGEKTAETTIQYRDDEIHPDTYWLTRIVFLRFLAFIYFVAFSVAYYQNKELIGDTGLLPVQLHMNTIVNLTNGSWVGKLAAAPTLMWLADPWDQVNPWLDNIALAGMTLAGLVCVLGSANMVIMGALWFLYFSIVSVGQIWYGFGWESQLLETGFLAVWSVPLLSLSPLPRGSPPTPIMVMGLRWLIFRIMLGAGLIKLRGDSCWWYLSCMNYHYETQPVPNPISWYLHQSPDIIHRLETLGNHIIELFLPFLTFLIREARMICGGGQIAFQIVLIISGNLSFLNWLTIVPSLAYFDDRTYAAIFTPGTRKTVMEYQKLEREKSPLVDPGKTRRMVNNAIGALIAVLSLPVAVNLLSARQVMNTSFEPFRIVNTYGAFGSISKERTEVILQGTHSRDHKDNSTVWLEYEFKCKPGRTDATPCFISPYHYRLDWLMWFAALQSFEHHPWLVHLAGKMLINDKEATTLLAYNPFIGDNPPKFVRAMSYKYRYTSAFNNSGDHWYTREEAGMYLPPVNINTLKLIFRRLNWRTLVGKKQQ